MVPREISFSEMLFPCPYSLAAPAAKQGVTGLESSPLSSVLGVGAVSFPVL